jgi:hypothetical protein
VCLRPLRHYGRGSKRQYDGQEHKGFRRHRLSSSGPTLGTRPFASLAIACRQRRFLSHCATSATPWTAPAGTVELDDWTLDATPPRLVGGTAPGRPERCRRRRSWKQTASRSMT